MFSLGQLTPFFVQRSYAPLTTQEDFRLLRVSKERGRKKRKKEGAEKKEGDN